MNGRRESGGESRPWDSGQEVRQGRGALAEFIQWIHDCTYTCSPEKQLEVQNVLDGILEQARDSSDFEDMEYKIKHHLARAKMDWLHSARTKTTPPEFAQIVLASACELLGLDYDSLRLGVSQEKVNVHEQNRISGDELQRLKEMIEALSSRVRADYDTIKRQADQLREKERIIHALEQNLLHERVARNQERVQESPRLDQPDKSVIESLRYIRTLGHKEQKSKLSQLLVSFHPDKWFQTFLETFSQEAQGYQRKAYQESGLSAAVFIPEAFQQRMQANLNAVMKDLEEWKRKNAQQESERNTGRK